MVNVKQLFRTRRDPSACYAAIVAAARQPKFYAEMGVPDAIDARLDMLVLHVFLVLRQLKRGARTDFAQGLTDAFFADIEDNFRELGLSDQAVAKKMRAVEEIYSGRLRAYDAALQQSEAAFEAALMRNVLAGGPAADAGPLAHYCREVSAKLEAATMDDIEAGKVGFA
jgi:cytochrome b pre-mRNA-processing protein 3